MFCLMVTVVASDTGGYAVGVLLGKHPMVPAISPKKSWEGLPDRWSAESPRR